MFDSFVEHKKETNIRFGHKESHKEIKNKNSFVNDQSKNSHEKQVKGHTSPDKEGKGNNQQTPRP